MSDTAHSANAPSGSGLRFQRILLKISGEALAGDRGVGFDFEWIGPFAAQSVDVGTSVAPLVLVIGCRKPLRCTPVSPAELRRVAICTAGSSSTADTRDLLPT